MAGSTSSGGAPGGVGAIGATPRLQPALRDFAGLVPGAVLRLTGGGDRAGQPGGWRLESLDSGEVMTLIEPPLDDLLPGDQLLLRVRAVVPRMELEVVERRRDPAGAGVLGGAGARGDGEGGPPSGWSQLSALRVDLAQWRRQLLTAVVETPPARTPAALVSAWTLALAHGQVPVGPGGEPLWLLPLPYWVRAERHGEGAGQDPRQDPRDDGRPATAGASTPAAEEPALSLLLRWRGEAIGLQLQGTRAALSLTVLAEHDPVLAALRGELPRVVAALVRAGFRLRRLGWRRQPLWVPVDPSPPMRSDASLLSAAAELVTTLG
ncbi:hypothetical protein [Mitsuaria sp. GD03876]|uniref:hypothetical protein n=1 Tax=Mitsuaria sp. GD03876 TaxID=2975399 RepID=UPI00244C5BBA|nr:hypothetical protein [Mitsuaria sp. GD03876]MDH0868244.1 hypothetical protein [Mitsuaria sp. GD03876]